MHYILLAPAKTMKLSEPQTFAASRPSDAQCRDEQLGSAQAWLAALPVPTQQIIDRLSLLEEAEVQKLFKLSPAKLREVMTYIAGFGTEEVYEAIAMYEGMVFKALDVASLTPAGRVYIDEHLLILSAFYGALRASDLIKPYRLDFNTALKVDGLSLKALWKSYYEALIPAGSLVFNLASDEFSSQFDASAYDWVDFDFFELRSVKGGPGGDAVGTFEKKRHSTIAKKGRGRLLRAMAEHHVSSREDIRALPDYGRYFELA